MLGCDSDAAAWRHSRPLPIQPGYQNLWVVRVRAPADATPEQLLALVHQAFSLWLPLFPDGMAVGLPYLYNTAATPLTPTIAELDAPGEYFREPSHDVAVKFSLGGSSSHQASIGWPTYAARRRERKDPLCPDGPIDTAPVSVHTPLGPALIVGPTVQPAEPQDKPDPLDAGLPQIDADALQAALKRQLAEAEKMAWKLAIVGALGFGIVLAVRSRAGGRKNYV